jgi:hypothetical protein
VCGRIRRRLRARRSKEEGAGGGPAPPPRGGVVVLRSHRQLAKWRDLFVSLGMFVVDLI